MQKREPTWDVVATVDECPVIVLVMISWHLEKGAGHIFLYCDRPDDPVAAMCAHLPQVTVFNCDAAYWQNAGIARPARHEERQVHNATAAYRQSQADWIVHIDADEFLWPKQTIGQMLGDVSEGVDGVVVGVAERMHRAEDRGVSIFEGGFRRPFDGTMQEGRALFGRAFHMTYKGLMAHAQGKVFVRTRRALSLSIHRARPEMAGATVNHQRLGRGQIELLHFDGLTALQWQLKLTRMGTVSRQPHGKSLPLHRERQLAALQKEGPALYPRVKGPDPKLQDALIEHHLWVEPEFDPSDALARYFPDQTLDLRPDVVDEWLRAHRDASTSVEKPE